MAARRILAFVAGQLLGDGLANPALSGPNLFLQLCPSGFGEHDPGLAAVIGIGDAFDESQFLEFGRCQRYGLGADPYCCSQFLAGRPAVLREVMQDSHLARGE